MSTLITDLWPSNINLQVLPPTAILKAQEGYLAQKTKGMLQAKLTTTETDTRVQHQLDLIAPSLNFYRERLLSATHDQKNLYPVIVSATCFRPKPTHTYDLSQLNPSLSERTAATDQELVDLVRQVLQSNRVRGLIYSLIARINQQSANSQEKKPAEQG